MHELTIQPPAEADIAAIYAWYEAQRPGLGEEFAAALRDGLQDICLVVVSFGGDYA